MKQIIEKLSKITVSGVMNGILWLTFALALSSSVQHLAFVAGTLETIPQLGWLTALAIDFALAVIAYNIQQKRRLNQSTWELWIGLVVIALISASANLYHALYVEAGQVATTSAITSVDWLELVKASVLSGLLPLLVVFLGEVISNDSATALKEQESNKSKLESEESKRQAKLERDAERAAKLEDAKMQAELVAQQNETLRLQLAIEQAKQAEVAKQVAIQPEMQPYNLESKSNATKELVFKILSENPDITNARVGEMIGRSGEIARTYKKELQTEGRLNGVAH